MKLTLCYELCVLAYTAVLGAVLLPVGGILLSRRQLARSVPWALEKQKAA